MALDLQKLVSCVGLCLAAGSVFTYTAIPTWYAGLAKPWFSPPNWVFGPVWTVLYVLMGVSAYLVWSSKKSIARNKALAVFAVQLVFNFFWSIAFFGLKSPFLGLVVIVPLWLSIAACILLFWELSKKASALLFPYLLWVSFAILLNYAILALNP